MESTLSNDAEEGHSQKMTIYLLFSNVKAFDTFCEVELQVWLTKV